MRAFFSRFLPVVGFVFLALILVFQFWYESAGRQMFYDQQVVKLKGDVKHGDIVTNDMWFFDKVSKGELIDKVVTDPGEIVGKAAKQFIPYNAQLSAAFFDLPELITDQDHKVVKIPSEWLFSIPDTLRARDKIVLKEVTHDVISTELSKIDVKVTANQDPSAGENGQTNASAEIIPTYGRVDTAGMASRSGEIVLETTVAYVKDSSNREVTSVGNVDRQYGSAAIRSVEIVATVKDIQTLEDYVKQGSKFIIMYSEGQ